jgi:sugar phosphate isomerase/epimerase
MVRAARYDSVDGLAVDLVYCSATDLSRPFLDKVAAASSAGFQGISLTIPDYLSARAAGVTDSQLAGALEEHRLFIAEVSTSTRWLEGTPNDEEQLGFELARKFSARGLNCTALNATYRGIDEAVHSFGAVCDRAAELNVKCHIEFVPWKEPRDLETTWEIVRRADRPNAGLMFDTWHFYRSGGQPDQLYSVDPLKIFGVQLSDAYPQSSHDDPMADALDRLLPGRGNANVVECVRVLLEMGVTVPFGGEVPSPCWSAAPPSRSAREVFGAMEEVLDLARRYLA